MKMTATDAYQLAVDNGPCKELEPFIATVSFTSYFYALVVLDGPFPAGEEAISKDAFNSYRYADDILKGPFPSGEAAIATDAWSSYYYARSVLKRQFTIGEDSIRIGPTLKSVFHYCLALDYQFRFRRDVCSLDALSKHPLYALAHAISIRGRFPEGEPAMQRSPRIWRRYQEFIDGLL